MTAVVTAPPRPRRWGAVRTVLRLHRAALLVWTVAVLGVVARLVWIAEVSAEDARAEQRACARAGQNLCDLTFDVSGFGDPVGWIALPAGFASLAVAAFAGGALIGRELENGTARLAWAQGITPARWLAAKLAVPALAVALGTIVLVVAFRWTWDATQDLRWSADWLSDGVFLVRGPTAVAYALCALALGTLAALLLRRALPALAVAVAAAWLLRFALERARVSLWPTVTRTSAGDVDTPESAAQVAYGVLVDGRPRADVDYTRCAGKQAEIQRCLDDLGVTGHFSTFHPESHFWPLQLVESGIVLAVAALATTAAFLLLRRRTV
ncbi:hypothetical protein [Streptomyces sp. NPDC002328]|uniref:hypothetical protein n=1 Tax=Streptomyces sp. NPDC002328 TaxID=3364642 RepID=UPI0036AE8D0D